MLGSSCRASSHGFLATPGSLMCWGHWVASKNKDLSCSRRSRASRISSLTSSPSVASRFLASWMACWTACGCISASRVLLYVFVTKSSSYIQYQNDFHLEPGAVMILTS